MTLRITVQEWQVSYADCFSEYTGVKLVWYPEIHIEISIGRELFLIYELSEGRDDLIVLIYECKNIPCPTTRDMEFFFFIIEVDGLDGHIW